MNVQPYGLDGHAARHPSTAGRPVRIEPVLVLRHRAATATRRLRRLRRRANVESRDSPRAPLRTTPTPSAASLRRPPPAAKRKRPRRRDRCAARGRVPRAAERAEQAHVGRPGRRTGTRHCPHRSKAAPCLRCPNSTVTLPPPRPVETRPSKPRGRPSSSRRPYCPVHRDRSPAHRNRYRGPCCQPRPRRSGTGHQQTSASSAMRSPHNTDKPNDALPPRKPNWLPPTTNARIAAAAGQPVDDCVPCTCPPRRTAPRARSRAPPRPRSLQPTTHPPPAAVPRRS